jgi:hypothetical protein
MRRAAFFAGLCVVASGSAGACTVDHSQLAKGDVTAASSTKAVTTTSGQTTDGTGGTTGEGGNGGAGGTGEQGAQTVNAASTAVSTTTGGPMEPSGKTKLTFVNGIVDQDTMRFCMSKYPAGAGSELPWPAAGIAWARSQIFDATVVPAGSDVEVRAVAGTAAAIAGKTCADLVAAPPAGVIVQSLGVVPQTAFSEPKSILFVAYGCTGGPTHTSGLQTLACGQTYKPDVGTAALMVGFMSRLGGAGAVRLQFADAMGAIYSQAQLSGGIVPGMDGAQSSTIASPWALGAIMPFPPSESFSQAALGDLNKAKVEVRLYGSPTTVPMLDALKNGGLTAADVKNGEGLVFVAVGAQPGIGDGPWWHKATYVAVKSDP